MVVVTIETDSIWTADTQIVFIIQATSRSNKRAKSILVIDHHRFIFRLSLGDVCIMIHESFKPRLFEKLVAKLTYFVQLDRKRKNAFHTIGNVAIVLSGNVAIAIVFCELLHYQYLH
eukprot:SAG31_NODE_684_length_12833_cov_8.046411_8_plen_117_part_00